VADNTRDNSENAYRNALKSARPALSSVVMFSAILNVLMLTGSLYMLQVYDRVLPGGSVPTLVVLFGIVVICFAFLGFYDFLRTRLLSRIALRLEDQLSAPAFRKWLDAGLPHAQNPADAQVIRDLETARGFLSSSAVTAMADLLFVPLFLVVLFIIHPWLGILTIIGAGVGAVIAMINRTLTNTSISDKVNFDRVERNFNMRSQRNAEAIQAMGMHEVIARQWCRLHHATLAISQKSADPSEVLAASSRAFRMLLQSSILTLGALLVLRGEISAGMIIASSVLSGRALAPVDQMIGQWRLIGAFVAAHGRLEAAFGSMVSEPERMTLPDPTGQIMVSKLTRLGQAFKNGDRKVILSEVSFELEAGDAMGVVGHSASGKSSLARLLVGADQADEGEIRLDGATLDQWHPAELGRNIGYLPQVVDMLPGTVQQNISRFQDRVSDDAVIAAAKLTGIHEMILKLPDGYNTRLAEPDSPPMLSGGQMQRLGLARAIYKLPRLVVLDEPNASLDMAGDEALTNVIRQLRNSGSTVIVLAHRPNVLRTVNKLLVLNKGKLAAFGDHEALLTEDYKIRAALLQTPGTVQPTGLDTTLRPNDRIVPPASQKFPTEVQDKKPTGPPVLQEPALTVSPKDHAAPFATAATSQDHTAASACTKSTGSSVAGSMGPVSRSTTPAPSPRVKSVPQASVPASGMIPIARRAKSRVPEPGLDMQAFNKMQDSILVAKGAAKVAPSAGGLHPLPSKKSKPDVVSNAGPKRQGKSS